MKKKNLCILIIVFVVSHFLTVQEAWSEKLVGQTESIDLSTEHPYISAYSEQVVGKIMRKSGKRLLR